MTRSMRAATAVLLPEGSAPPEILLMPAGEVRTRQHDRRDPWRNTDAEAVIAATVAENGGEFQVNYDHQPGPAAGWVKRLFARDGAIWAAVEWTERAVSTIRAKEYRFISPEFLFEEKSRRVRLLTGAALTNDPALYMRAIANTQNREETSMDLEKLRKALGLSETATEAEILAAATAAAAAATALADVTGALGLEKDAEPKAVATAVSAMATGRKAIAKAAGLAEDASSDDVETAVKTAKASASASAPDPASFVPRAEFDRVNERLNTLEAGTAQSAATAKVDQAVKDGKVAPASRDWALAYAAKDPEGFDKFLEGAPKILEDGRVAPAGEAGGGDDALTTDEKAVCRAMGLSEEDYLKSKKALAEAGEEG